MNQHGIPEAPDQGDSQCSAIYRGNLSANFSFDPSASSRFQYLNLPFNVPEHFTFFGSIVPRICIGNHMDLSVIWE